MEFLKELFGNEPLTYDQLVDKATEKKMKVVDLSGGEYVGREKLNTIIAERDDLQTRLNEANEMLEGYDPDWKQKAEQAQIEADNKIKAMQKKQLYKEQTTGLKFSSESAKRAFFSDLEAKDLPVEDDRVLGLDDFIKQYQESDPNAFLPDKPVPSITIPGRGAAPQSSTSQVLDQKYAKNPFYKSKGE